MWSVLAITIGTLLEYTHNLLNYGLWENFSPKKAFFSRGDWGGDKPFWEKLWEIALHGGLMIALFIGRGEFHKYIFQQSEHYKSGTLFQIMRHVQFHSF